MLKFMFIEHFLSILGGFNKNGDFTWRVSDCEVLEGDTHRRWVCCSL